MWECSSNYCTSIHSQFLLVPVKVLDTRIVKRNNSVAGQWLAEWVHTPSDEATWEFADEISSFEATRTWL